MQRLSSLEPLLDRQIDQITEGIPKNVHKWIGTYNTYRVHLLRFFKWLYAPHTPPAQRPKPAVVENMPNLKCKEISHYKPSDLS